jgi:hypothetical protein
MPRYVGVAVQLGVFFVALFILPTFWVMYAFLTYPWIVIADAVGNTSGHERASFVALSMALVSMLSSVLASGIIDSRRTRWAFAAALLIAHAVAACYLYPFHVDAIILICLTAQMVGIAVVIMGAACGLPESSP